MSSLLSLNGPTFVPAGSASSLVPAVVWESSRPQTVHLRGGNGSGKSTLIELCSGWISPTAGSIEVEGRPADDPEIQRRRVVLREQPALYAALTIAEHVAFASRVHGVPPDHGTELAHRLGLEPWLDTAVRHLSTGTRKKAWLVVCTLGAWRTGFFDEPFLGLDAGSVDVLNDLFDEWTDTRLALVSDHTGSLRGAGDVIDLGRRPQATTGVSEHDDVHGHL